MAKYRRKPKFVEAEQWFPGKEVKGVILDPAHNANSPNAAPVVIPDQWYVETIHAGQRCYLEPGDYILPEPDGIHFYPVKAAIFEAEHELADGEE